MREIDRKKIKCPLCGKGMGTIEIDGFKQDLTEFDCHCTECNIWFSLSVVTDKEKKDMFTWY